MSDNKVEIQRAVVLAILNDGTIHQVALDMEKEKTLLWLIEELCEGQIKVVTKPIKGLKFGGTNDATENG
jgi:hypothetical protein